MTAVDDLTAAATRIEAAVADLISALGAATPDLQPVIDGLSASAQAAENALAPPDPSTPPAESAP